MKVVLVDDYRRETASDLLLQENLTETDAKRIAENYNNRNRDAAYMAFYAMVKPNDYVLHKSISK